MKHCFINPHLIDFFFQTFEGKRVNYEGKQINNVLFSTSSPISQYLFHLAHIQSKNAKIYFYISLEYGISKIKKGLIYQEINGKKEPLFLEEATIQQFNNLLQSLFNLHINSYISGMVSTGLSVTDAVKTVLEHYALEEYNIEFESLRIMYYRSKKNKMMYSFQNKEKCYNKIA